MRKKKTTKIIKYKPKYNKSCRIMKIHKITFHINSFTYIDHCCQSQKNGIHRRNNETGLSKDYSKR